MSLKTATNPHKQIEKDIAPSDHFVGNSSLWLALMCLLTACVARGNPAPEAPGPSWPVAVRPLVFEEQAPVVPVVLAGYDIRMKDSLLTESPPRIQEGGKLDLRLYLRPLGEIPGGQHLRLEIEGSGPVRKKDYPLDAKDWEPGHVYTQDCAFPLWRVWCTGAATLWFSLPPEPGSKERGPVLYATPVHVAPTVAESGVDPARVRKALGAKATPLNKAFSLGVDAAVVVELPAAAMKTAFERVGIVSALGWAPPQPAGTTVASLQLLDESGAVMSEAAIVAGRDTLLSDIDHYDYDAPKREGIGVFSEEDTESKDKKGRPLKKRYYTAVIEIGSDTMPNTLRFAYKLRAGQLRVSEIALVPAAPMAPPAP